MIEKAIDENDTKNRSEVILNCIKLRGVKRLENEVKISKVIISVSNPLDVHLHDILNPLNGLESEGIIIIDRMIEC